MHLPYIAHLMGSRPYTLVPIMVGALSEGAEEQYGRLLARYLSDPHNLFIISTDFCHWGERFNFTFHDPAHGQIYQSIQALDEQGMDLIEKQDAKGYAKYQRDFGNTICGRHPIAVLLHTLAACAPHGHKLKFVSYAQSSECRRVDESSVSYASAVVYSG